MNKLPQITLVFWIMKICATTLSEIVVDLFYQKINMDQSISSLILIGLFLAFLYKQLTSTQANSLLYWIVILVASAAGTTMSDVMARTLWIGYTIGSVILVSAICIILTCWHVTQKSLSVSNIKSFNSEIIYWTIILLSNTLGTMLGYFLADNSGLVFSGGTKFVASLLVLISSATFFTNIPQVLLFWSAFILTNPFGKICSDLFLKPIDKGGLGFGVVGSSVVFVTILFILFICSSKGSDRALSE